MKFLRFLKNLLRQKIVRIVLIALALIVVVVAILSVLHEHKEQVINNFGTQRGKVVSTYVYSVVGFTPDDIKQPPPKCDDYSEFVNVMKKDTRDMSSADLERALTLWDECHYDVTSEQYSLDSDFSSQVSKLIGINAEIKDPDIAPTAQEISSTWRKIQTLKSEKTDIINESVDGEQLYWRAELNYKEGKDSFSQRQDTFQELNDKTKKNNDRTEQIDSQLKELGTTESDQWNIFITKTGFREETS